MYFDDVQLTNIHLNNKSMENELYQDFNAYFHRFLQKFFKSRGILFDETKGSLEEYEEFLIKFKKYLKKISEIINQSIDQQNDSIKSENSEMLNEFKSYCNE